MHALIVHCHPEPHSFNAALSRGAVDTLERRGHSVEVSDLYAEGFDPVERPDNYPLREDSAYFSALGEQRHAWKQAAVPADVAREIERLERADLVILQFPLWWHAQPAMLKGWFDRVFLSGGLYTSRMRYDAGYFRGKRAICSLTTGAPAEAFGPGGRGGDLDTLLWPIQYSLYYMGFTVLPAQVSYGVQGHGFSYAAEDEVLAQLQGNLSAWSERLARLDRETPIPFPGWSDWDALGRPLPGETRRASAG